jgi:(p)ppGpp synthase/HD superfamily hydrolase
VNLTHRFDEALAFALDVHRDQKRKGKDVPYAAHLLSVAGLVLHFGGTEDQAIAALLHDAAEDAGGPPMLERIRGRFGAAVARIVEDCTDTMETPKPAWRERKERYVASVAEKPAASLLVTACDKLDNARAIVADLRVHGRETLGRFAGGDQTLWYYREITSALRAAGAGTPAAAVAAELEVAVREMMELAGAATRSAP